MREALIEKKFNKAIEDAGGWVIKLLPYLVSGLPDRLALLPGGIIFFAEIKTTGKNPSPRQNIVHKKIRKLGFSVYIIDNPELIEKAINERR